VEELCLANVRDIPKMLRWNDKYGIKFMRLSCEMFLFASHTKYGYKLAPFASEALAEARRVSTGLGHRLSTHPGQFTQLGLPRPEVIANALRDLEYHDELLSLLKLPEQEDRDAVMILHMGGTLGDKAATLRSFPHQLQKALSIHQATPRPRKRRRLLVRPRPSPNPRRTKRPPLSRFPPPQHNLPFFATPRRYTRHRGTLPSNQSNMG
jgi:UV damage endonuclease UvdE